MYISKTALKENLEDKNLGFDYRFFFTFTFHKPTSNTQYLKNVYLHFW